MERHSIISGVDETLHQSAGQVTLTGSLINSKNTSYSNVYTKKQTDSKLPMDNHSICADIYQDGLAELAESVAKSLISDRMDHDSVISGVGVTLQQSTGQDTMSDSSIHITNTFNFNLCTKKNIDSKLCIESSIKPSLQSLEQQTELGCKVIGENKSHHDNMGNESMNCLQNKQEPEEKESLSQFVCFQKNKNLNRNLVLSKPLLEAPIQLYTGRGNHRSERVSRNLNVLPINKGKKYNKLSSKSRNLEEEKKEFRKERNFQEGQKERLE